MHRELWSVPRFGDSFVSLVHDAWNLQFGTSLAGLAGLAGDLTRSATDLRAGDEAIVSIVNGCLLVVDDA